LANHPDKELIVNRYLKRQRNLTRMAMERLLEEDQSDTDEVEQAHADEEQAVERRISLNDQRLGAVMAVLTGSGTRRVLDLGCNTGNLLRCLLREKQFESIVGMDVSHRVLEIAADKLRLERMPPTQRKRIELIHGSLGYRDRRLAGFDAAAVVEVIEHLDPPRLAAFERVLFEFAKPRTIVITTPNVEYNVRFETLPAGRFRHKDHRFEWTRQQFHDWADTIAARFDYAVRFLPVGSEDPAVGSPTQMAVFTSR
jgi:3' terminal RNA ribose 2'-O-methyltransferase Hen1